MSISSGGTVIAVGAYKNDGTGTNAGHTCIYQYTTSWIQVNADIDGEAAQDQSGYSVSLSSDGSIVSSGANKNDGSGAADCGSVRILEEATLSVSQNTLSPKFLVYPNPSTEQITIELGEMFREVQIKVFDMSGKETEKSFYTNTRKISLTTNNYPTGVYLVEVQSENKRAVLRLSVK